MDKLTLDTNALRDWAWSENRTSERRYGNNEDIKRSLRSTFDNLRNMSNDGRCEIGITTQIYTDYEKTVGELPDYVEDMIGPHAEVSISSPSISTLPWTFPVVFADENEIDEIFADVFPNSEPHHRKFEKNRKDALQLYAHRVASRDYFITTDATILRAKDILSSKWAVLVETPGNYVALVCGRI